MNTSVRKARIRWQCRRGMLELDLILNQFVDRHLETLTEHQLGQMESLLDCSDPELYSWLLDSESPGDKELHDIVQLVRSYR